MMTEKKKSILDKLIPYMPKRKTEFWHSLKTNDAVVDLVCARDPAEAL